MRFFFSASKCFCYFLQYLCQHQFIKVHVLKDCTPLSSVISHYFNMSFTEFPIRLVSPTTSIPSPYLLRMVLYFLSCIVPSISLIIFLLCVFLHIIGEQIILTLDCDKIWSRMNTLCITIVSADLSKFLYQLLSNHLHNDLYQLPFVLYVHSLSIYLVMFLQPIDNLLDYVSPPSIFFVRNQVHLGGDNLSLLLSHFL